MDRLEAMSTLLAVVEAGSLSAASRRLGTPLATVSRRISELEAHLKTRLLQRSIESSLSGPASNSERPISTRCSTPVRSCGPNRRPTSARWPT